MKRKSSGYSLLEFLFTLPFTLLFLFGASDTMKVMRAQTALDNATDDALRCLTPINGACRGSVNDNVIKQYDVYKINTTGSRWVINEYAYGANAMVLERPTYDAEISANVVTSADYSFTKYKTGFEEQAYSAQVSANYYLMTKSLPKINGNDLDGLTYVLKNDNGKTYSPIVDNSSGFTLTVQKGNNSADSSKTISFSIPALKDCDTTLPCFIANDVDKKNASSDDFTNNCQYNVCSGKVPILIAIEGDKKFNNALDSGQVLIELQDNNGKTVRDLGGRVFTNDSSASFVPRGGEESNFSSWLQKNYGGENQEIQLHKEISVKYNTNYKLRFALRSISKGGQYVNSNDKIQWIFKRLRIFAPEFMKKSSTKDCANGILSTKLATVTTTQQTLSMCQPSGLQNGEEKLPFKLQKKSIKGGSGNIIYSQSCGMTKQSINNVLKQNDIDLKFQADFKEVAAMRCQEEETVTVNCNNNSGKENVIKNKSLCPYTSVTYDWKNEEKQNILKSISNLKIDNKKLETRSYTLRDCNDSKDNFESEIKSDYANYDDLIIAPKEKKSYIKLPEDCNELSEFQKDNNYECFSTRFISLKDNENSESQTTSLLIGKHIDKANWRKEAISLAKARWNHVDGISNACFNVSRTKTGKTTVDTEPEEGVEYSFSSNDMKENLESLGTFNGEGYPESCYDESNRLICKKVFKGFIRNNNANANANDDLDIEQAKGLATQRIHDHLNVEDNQIKVEGEKRNNIAFFQSSVNIPLNILLGKAINLTSSSAKEIEEFN